MSVKYKKKLNELDILSIDPRITSCYIENMDDDSDEFYVKVYFNFIWVGDFNVNDNGRQEFISHGSDQLLDDLRKFFNIKHNYMTIV